MLGVTWGARVLGELALTRDGQPVELPVSRRARVLLAWLAVNPGVHTRADVAARLRPDVREQSARMSLRQAAWALRPLLGPVLVSDRLRIGLLDGAVSVDLLEFRRHAVAGDREGALALTSGGVLVGLDEPWIDDLRTAHLHEVDALLEQMSSAALPPGASPARNPEGHARALRYTRERITRDPLCEPAYRELMRLLERSGDRAAALTAYRELSERLRRELHVAPSPATRQLADELREPEPLGETQHRGPADRSATAATVASERPPFPWRLAALSGGDFVGRHRELAKGDAVGRERAGTPSAVIVGGESGIGKTRLASIRR